MEVLMKYWLTYLLCSLGIICLIAFNVIGSYVDENGMLIEAFALLPLFWIFQGLSVVSLLVTYLRSRASRQ